MGAGPEGPRDNGAARLADLILVPCHGPLLDMETLPSVRDLVQAAGGEPAFVIYTGVPPLGSRIADGLKTIIKSYCGQAPCPVHLLTRRHAYEEAPASGHAGQEIDREGKIAAEVGRLYLFIREQVKEFSSEHNEREKSVETAERA